ncbi:MAG: AI-2E family transporter [Actinomycetota bacterium]|nr:AI-2E family transporter [Actinomycetota bacterium]
MPANSKPAEKAFARKALIAVLIALGCTLCALFVVFAVRILLVIFLAILFSTLIRGISGFLSKTLRLPDTISVFIIYLSVAVLLFLIYILLVPSIAAQASEMGRKLSESWTRVSSMLGAGPAGKFIGKTPKLESLIGGNAIERVKSFLSSLSGIVIDLVVIFFITVYMSFEPKAYMRGIFSLFPERKRASIQELFNSMGTALRRWLVGTLIEMALVGTLSALGLHFIGVPLALSLGILAMLLTFVPYLGAIVSAIPALLIALLTSPATTVYVIFLYLFIHTLDGYVVYPLIQRYQIKLPPGIIIIAQVLLGSFAGILGVIAATPLTALVVEFIKKVYIEDVLKGKTASPEG